MDRRKDRTTLRARKRSALGGLFDLGGEFYPGSVEHIYWADSGDNKIHRTSPNEVNEEVYTSSAHGAHSGTNLRGIAVDKDAGFIYLCDWGASADQCDLDGNYDSELRNASGIYGVAFDATNRYFGSTTGDWLFNMPKPGTLTNNYELAAPDKRHVAVNSTYIFVSTNDNGIYRYNISGALGKTQLSTETAVFGVAWSEALGRVIYCSNDDDQIKTMLPDGTDKQVVISLDFCDDIAANESNSNLIYYTASTGIYVGNIVTGNVLKLANAGAARGIDITYTS